MIDLGRTVFLAHHMLLLAIPAFAPAIAVVGVILYVAIRDRRAGHHETAAGHQKQDRH
jgi:hypothetical protein